MKAKRFLLSLLAILANISIYAHDIAVANEDGVTIYYRYVNNNTELAVTYQGTSYATYSDEYSGNVVIPESVSYNGKTFSVTSIVNYAFRDCSSLTSIIIPESVISIGGYAFYGCSGLTSITIPNSVTTIGYSSFSGCFRLTSVTIPESLTSIGGEVFLGCSGLTSITIPESVTSIGKSAFDGCSGLTSITIPNGVISIDDNAFHGCSSLMSVTIGNSVTGIGSSAFSFCTSLTSVTIPEGVTSIGSQAFYFCSSLTSVTIGNSVTSIDDNAFASTPWLNNQPNGLVYAGKVAYKYKGTMPSNTSIILEEGTIGIAYGAFKSCTGLTSVIIPESVTSIGPDAFSGCSGLTSVTVPESVTTIGIAAFSGCSRLTSITIPNSVTTINASAFNNCSSLTSVTIPESVTSIGDYAFRNCSRLTSVTIPSGVTSIGNYAFYDSRLTTLRVESENPIPIQSQTFNNTTIVTLYVPAGSKVAYEAADYWKVFRTIVEMESSTASVVTAPTAKELVYTGSAQELITPGEASGGTMQYSLDGTNYSPDIPTGTDVGEYTVYYKVVGDGDHSDTEPATVSVSILPSSHAITFADANVKALCVDNWDTNGDGELSEAETAAVTTLGEVFKGNAEITSFDELQYFTGLTEIADGAFNECTKLESVILPSEVTRIGNWAFTTCNSLNTITIPASVTDIGAGAFAGCINMISMTVDTENTVYDSREDCNAIIHSSTNTVVAGCKNMTIPEGVTSIGDWALNGMGSLTSVVLPSSLTSIGTGAFSWCWSLPSITIPANVTSIGGGSFEGCGNLTSVTVENPEPVAIEESSFSNRANATLYVPAGSTVAYKAADYWKEFKEIVELVNIVTNSDMEGTDNVSFFSRENYLENEEIVPSTIVEGTGVDGSRGIVVQSIDNPVNKWDTQFFIRLPQTLPAGTNYYISFDYKASQEASGSTETHAEPSQYLWYGIGTINYTADWKHFELIGTVSAEQSPADNPMRTIAFNLAVTPTSTTYYFDNVVFEIDKSQITPVAIVAEAPTPKELTFTGEAQELINPGRALFGTMQYSLDGTNYSTSIPTGTDAGEYTVYYKVVGDEDHSDSEVATVSVTIAEAMVEETNYLTAADISGIAGGSTSLVISLENEDPIYDIQFKLQLPEGVVVNKNSDNQYKVSYSDRLSGLSHEMSYREEGYYTFLIHGMENPISGNSGPIVTVGLTLSSELAGNYNIEISDIVLTKSDASKVKPRNVDVVLSLTDGQVGDVNRDGDIDVADIRCIANYILGKPNVFFDEDAADANNDGDIDVADIRTIANIILYGSNSSAKEFTDFNNDPQ